LYHTEIYIKPSTIEELKNNFWDIEKFEGFCKQCRNYGKLWSCPPYNFSIEEYVDRYKYVYIVGVKIVFDEDTLSSINTKEKISSYTNKTLHFMKNKMMNEMLKLEKLYPNSTSLSAGGCNLCENCSKLKNVQCIHPDLMRYSLESLGFDVGGVSSKLLNFELKWATETRLPDYFSLIAGIMTNEEITNLKENVNL
jgi:predicted metal-binding protein